LLVTDNDGATNAATVKIKVNPAAQTYDVKTLDLSSAASGSSYTVIGNVTFADPAGKGVAGVNVTAYWSGGVNGMATAKTDASGVATFKTTASFSKNKSITLTLISLQNPSGYTFSSSLYTEPTSRTLKVRQ
jgi:hypothetical protein